MDLILGGCLIEPMFTLVPRGGVGDAWNHPTDCMVVTRDDSGPMRVDFIGVASFLMAESAPASAATLPLDGVSDGLWESDDRGFMEFTIGRGQGDRLGWDGKEGLRTFFWKFDGRVLLRLTAEDVEVVHFECPDDSDPDGIWQEAFGLKAFVSDLEHEAWMREYEARWSEFEARQE